MADSGTLTVVEDSKFRATQKLTFTWQAGAGVATLEKTLNKVIRGKVIAIAHKPGAAPPTGSSDLDVYLEDDTGMTGPVVSSAVDGANIVHTAFTYILLTKPFIVHGKLRFKVTNNIVNDANGTFYLYIQPAIGPSP